MARLVGTHDVAVVVMGLGASNPKDDV